MRNLGWLQKTAGSRNIDDYPDGLALIGLCTAQVRELYETPGATITHEAIVAAVLAGIARADVQGMISVGDEHEWATLSLAATEQHWEATTMRPGKPARPGLPAGPYPGLPPREETGIW